MYSTDRSKRTTPKPNLRTVHDRKRPANRPLFIDTSAFLHNSTIATRITTVREPFSQPSERGTSLTGRSTPAGTFFRNSRHSRCAKRTMPHLLKHSVA
jgi:hypothetical protein